MKKIKELTLEEYNTLKASGLFWVLFPEATGNFKSDTKKEISQDEINRRQCIAAEQSANNGSCRER